MPLQTLLGPSARVFNLYPGGNPTYLVLDPAARPENYPEINRGILAQSQRWRAHFEQGGFIRPAASQEAVARLDMAGGEFCGNATRAFGATLLRDFLGSKEMQSVARFENITQDGAFYRFSVEVSGAGRPLEVLAREVDGLYEVQTEVPVRSEPSSISRGMISLNGTKVPISLVRLDGITHFVVDESVLPFEAAPAVYEDQLKLAIAQCGLTQEPAVGMIWRKSTGEYLQINPVVWVNSINTCFYESACGSGSVAVGMIEALRSEKSTQTVLIKQPSGSFIDVTIERNVRTNEFLRARISGSVEVREEISWRGES